MLSEQFQKLISENLGMLPVPSSIKDIENLKKRAKTSMKRLNAAGVHVKLTEVYYVAARKLGYGSWEALIGTIEKRLREEEIETDAVGLDEALRSTIEKRLMELPEEAQP